MSKRTTHIKGDLPGTTTLPELAGRRGRHDLINYAPRGLSRDEAARYVGIGSTKFDEMVADRRMPRPKQIDGRVVWDRLQIDAAFSDLPEHGRVNPLDRLLSKSTNERS